MKNSNTYRAPESDGLKELGQVQGQILQLSNQEDLW